MTECYKILYKEGTGEIEEKKSRFICNIRPVKTEEEAIAFIEEMKKKYWDARHNCSAYILGDRMQKKRCSDDGEPSQTAGRPMLDVLEGADVTDVCAVVTRYFGGTLLGTGGLVRAYSAAVQRGLENAVVVEKKLAEKTEIRTDYNGIGKIQYILAKNSITTLDTEYTDTVRVIALLPVGEKGSVISELTEGTGGKAGISKLSECYYGLVDSEVVLFDE